MGRAIMAWKNGATLWAIKIPFAKTDIANLADGRLYLCPTNAVSSLDLVIFELDSWHSYPDHMLSVTRSAIHIWQDAACLWIRPCHT